MSEKIFQRRALMTIEAELLQTGVRYSERGVFRTHDSIIPYEEIPEHALRFWNPSRLYILICVFFVLLILFQVHGYFVAGDTSGGEIALSALWLSMAGFGTWMRSPKYVGFYTRGNGVLFFDRAGENSPEPFMRRLQEVREAYLHNRYGVSTIEVSDSSKVVQHNVH